MYALIQYILPEHASTCVVMYTVLIKLTNKNAITPESPHCSNKKCNKTMALNLINCHSPIHFYIILCYGIKPWLKNL